MPASARQLAANRLNGAKGGPKTVEGRAAVRFNALRHGLAAVQVVLPGEDRDTFQELRDALLEDLAPVNTYQEALAEEVVRAYWRLLRLRGVETAMLTHHIEIRSHLKADAAIAQAFMEEPAETFRTYFRYDGVIERSYYRALQQFHRAQQIQQKQVSDSGIRFVQPADVARALVPAAGRLVGPPGFETLFDSGLSGLGTDSTPQHLVASPNNPQNSGLHLLYNTRESV